MIELSFVVRVEDLVVLNARRKREATSLETGNSRNLRDGI